MKKITYISLCAFMGINIGMIIHALAEKAIIMETLRSGAIPYNYQFLGKTCYLPPFYSIGFLMGGLVLGLVLGFRWWDIVYVKRKRHFKITKSK